MGRGLFLLGFVLSFTSTAPGEMLRTPTDLVGSGETRLTFEILPAGDDETLAEALHDFENVRFTVERRSISGRPYVRTRHVFPVAGGDPVERAVFFVEEDQCVRMLGFHRLRRARTGVEGDAIVFRTGGWNPLRGAASVVPPDTYTYLGLVLALAAVVDDPGPRGVHLWIEPDRAVPAEIIVGDLESLTVLGGRVLTRRLRVVPDGSAAPEASYWFRATSPHTPLQYVGPAEFVAPPAEAPAVRLRATSSSEHIHRTLEDR